MRKLFTFALSFAAAVFACRYGVLPALLLLPVLALLPREDRRLRLALACAGLVLGLLWSGAYEVVFRAPARALEGRTAPLTATVSDWPYETAAGTGVTVRVIPASGPSFLARLYAGEEGMDLRPGDRITVTAECRPADIRRGELSGSLTSKGIFLIAYARGPVSGLRPEHVPLQSLPAYWSKALKDQVSALFPPDVAPLVKALLTGDKTSLSDGDYAALRRVGLAHAVAVSGMHLSFLVGLASLLCGNRRRFAAVALPLLWLFALAAGGTPSVVRAAVMQTLLLLAPLLGRENDPPTSLSFALMLLLLQNPYAAESVSLQLSFSAVAGILLCAGSIQDWALERIPLPEGKGLPARCLRAAVRFAFSTLATTCGALVLTTPLAAWYFGGVSLAAPVSNLLCLPAVALVFALGLLAAVAGLVVPPLGPVLAAVATPLARYLLWITGRLSALPYASVSVDSAYLLIWLGFVYAVILITFAGKGAGRPIVPACCCVLTLAAALALNSLSFLGNTLALTMLDVGQGQCVLFASRGRTALLDCGGNEGNAGDLAADYLSGRGVQALDLLVLTHFHADHANGVPELLARMPVGTLCVPALREEDPLAEEIVALAEAQGTRVVRIGEDGALTLGEAAFTLYAPLGAGEANEEGLSLLVEAGDFSALFTGDMDAATEKRLVKYGALPDVDLLAAGHHGAKNAASALLLDTVTPELAFVSVGYNTYGHPAGDTLERLDQAGCAVYRTDLQGNLTVTVP